MDENDLICHEEMPTEEDFDRMDILEKRRAEIRMECPTDKYTCNTCNELFTQEDKDKEYGCCMNCGSVLEKM